MIRARKTHGGDQGISQKELGARVGTSQNMISLIESGEVESSTFVLPICDVLGIPPPIHYESEDQKTWSQLGHLLRHKSMKKFRAALELVKTMAMDEEAENAQASGPAAPPPPTAPRK